MKTLITLSPPDAELITQAVTGDTRAFRQLVERYTPIVYNFVYRMTQNAELSDDMTQEVFVKVFKNLTSFEASRPFKPWLLRIASNTTVSALRKQSGGKSEQAGSQVVSLDALQEEMPGKEWGGSTRSCEDPAHQAEVRELGHRVERALYGMESNYRQVLLLRYQEDLSYEEIAETLGVPINTVRTWIKRGRDRLKAQFSPFDQREAPL
jgi:RNA polymerase sigma-70 factor (ECF subfamily)